MEICKTCEFNSKNGSKKGPYYNPLRLDSYCLQCGCPLESKLRCLSCMCPDHRWEAIVTEDEENALLYKMDSNGQESNELGNPEPTGSTE